ncbi:aminoglycoside phosphotransferase family protein [Streptomyces anandii]|uniref:aminoglycoside phosphotransferase family protein n=1 Tax=Streptomyces anandii TaxID=285454 RepID=UPI00378F43D6
MTVDRGKYPDLITPWEDEAWRSDALTWLEAALAGRGLRPAGARAVRLRPWSVLVRVPVEGGNTVWFKANPPASAFEGPLTAALAQWVPASVLRPLAVDAGRGWSLLPDGGDVFRDVLDSGSADIRSWEEALRQYAALQYAVAPHARDMELLGVPSARTVDLPGLFGQLLARCRALAPDERRRLQALRPRLARWCAELADAGVPDSLDHADLHDGQLFHPGPGRFTFFDCGDAAVSHPFCSLVVPARRAADRFGPEALPRLRDAYLEPWTGGGRTAAGLRRAAGLAWRLAALSRATAWGRVFPSSASGTVGVGPAETARMLLELLTEPPS